MLKKLLIGLGGLLVLVMVVMGLFVSNLDSIIQAAVEKIGSEATQTTVELADVELSPTSGQGKLSGLRIANPDGFETPEAFVLGMIDVEVDMESVSGTGPIVIKKIIIEKPQVTFEMNEAGQSNMQVLAAQAQKFAGSAQSAKEEQEASESSDEPARKIIVKKLTVSGGQVSMSHSMMKGKKVEANIPAFTLNNLGQSQGGMTGEALANKLLSVISQKSVQAVSQNLIGGLSSLKKEGANLMDNIEKEGVNIKGLFGR